MHTGAFALEESEKVHDCSYRKSHKNIFTNFMLLIAISCLLLCIKSPLTAAGMWQKHGAAVRRCPSTGLWRKPEEQRTDDSQKNKKWKSNSNTETGSHLPDGGIFSHLPKASQKKKKSHVAFATSQKNYCLRGICWSHPEKSASDQNKAVYWN